LVRVAGWCRAVLYDAASSRGEDSVLGALLLSLSPPAPFAVAVNEEVVLRGSFEECLVYPGDRIDIVHPAAGG
jgi:thiamine biosynthesis protein ThiS